MKILTVTTLYPNAANTAHGVFVENRMRDFKKHHPAVDLRVLAPVPWFPVAHPALGKYARFAAAPDTEQRNGLTVDHPRYFLPPKIGMTYAVASLERCIYKMARGYIEAGWDFDLIDAHYLYPDGVAAMRVAQRLGKPSILTARGSDVSLIPNFPAQRRMILDAIWRCDGVICVAAALKDALIELGAPPEKIEVLRNGVDLDLFAPRDREMARASLSLTGPTIASVGHLINRKGHDLVIDALGDLREFNLLIIGEGEEDEALKQQAHRRGVADRVRFMGHVEHHDLPTVYSAIDALVLGSSREGWPNVLLEAMACGAPAVATPVWGSREVITAPSAGKLAEDRTPAAIASAVRDVIDSGVDRAQTRRYAEQFSWRETSEGLYTRFSNTVEHHRLNKDIHQAPVIIKKRSRPRLLFTVDTEEEFDWTGFDNNTHSICTPTDIDRLQQICAKHGAKPLYFLTYPLLQDPSTRAYFRNIVGDGAAHGGLHLHSWTTPPIGGFDGEYYSWQMNLPATLYREKLRRLADAFVDVFGAPAIAHRAGRYGVNIETYRALDDLGVQYDFSPAPGFDFSHRGGPSFATMSPHPFLVRQNPDGARTEEREQDANFDMTAMRRRRDGVIVTPVSGGLSLRGGAQFLSQAKTPPGFQKNDGLGWATPWRRAKETIYAPLKLTCEQSRLAELKSLTHRLIADDTPLLTFSLHSTSLTVGGNPYAPDQAAVDRMAGLVDDYLRYFVGALDGVIISLDDLDALYAADGR